MGDNAVTAMCIPNYSPLLLSPSLSLPLFKFLNPHINNAYECTCYALVNGRMKYSTPGDFRIRLYLLQHNEGYAQSSLMPVLTCTCMHVQCNNY